MGLFSWLAQLLAGRRRQSLSDDGQGGAAPVVTVQFVMTSSGRSDSAWERRVVYVPATLRLDYLDRAGRQSVRDVRLLEWSSSAADGVTGHCLLRNAQRSFRYDRISSAVDVASGECVADLRGWLAAREAAVASDMAALEVLVYVGRADGRLMAAEVAVICEYAREHTALYRPGGAVDAMLRNQVARIDDEAEFALRVRRCQSLSVAQRQALSVAAAAVVATQKRVTDAEARALGLLRGLLVPPAG